MDHVKVYELDWGKITPEGYSKTHKESLHVFNFDISSAENIKRCVIFATGRIFWLGKNLPQDVKQKIIFDLRGQPLALLDRARKMKTEIIKNVSSFPKQINLSIEILI